MKRTLLVTSISMALLTACGGGDSNKLPEFSQASYQSSVVEDTVLSATVSATDADNDSIQYSLANSPANGQVTIDQTSGHYDYTPNANFNGDDTFTIAASDNIGQSSVVVTVNVSAMNDLPSIDSSELLFSGGEIKQAQLIATDIDNDQLSYGIVEQATNGTVSIDVTTGVVSYAVDSLAVTADSFTVGVDDGSGEMVSAQIAITTSLATNEDRAYYYYSSEASRLKQAQQMSEALEDDVIQNTVNSSLVQGYARAGFEQEVSNLLDESNITNKNDRAFALLDAANEYNRLGKIELANQYRLQAQTLYTQYLATTGINNIQSADATFFVDLTKSYGAVNEYGLAENVYSLLDILFTSALTAEGSTNSLRLYFGFSGLVTDAIELWQADKTATNLTQAIALTDRLYSYAQIVPYNESRVDSSDFMASTKAVALSDALDYFQTLNQPEKSKSVLADLMALYGVVGIDENHPRTIDSYFQNTQAEYQWFVLDLAAPFVMLYPEADIAILDQLMPGEDFISGLIRDYLADDAKDASLLAQVAIASEPTNALALIQATKDEDDLRAYYTDVIRFNNSTPGAAVLFINRGQYEHADVMLQEGLTLIQQPQYIEQQGTIATFISGASGCGHITTRYLEMAAAQPDADYRDKAQQSALVCYDLVMEHFSDDVQAIADVISHLALLQQTAQLTNAINSINLGLDAYTAEQQDVKLNMLRYVGSKLALGHDFTNAQAYYNRAIALVKTLESGAVETSLGNTTDDFFADRSSETDYSEFIEIIDTLASDFTGLAAIKQTAIAAISDLFADTITKLDAAPSQTQLQNIPLFADHYNSLGNTDAALTLAQKDSLGDVEAASIIASVARTLAQQDDFPTSIIASVDTDGDGMPNFFANFATEAMIIDSGLILDPDSDNDGVDDIEDAYPLDKSRQ